MTEDNKNHSFFFFPLITSKARKGSKSNNKLAIICGLIDNPIKDKSTPVIYFLSNNNSIPAVDNK